MNVWLLSVRLVNGRVILVILTVKLVSIGGRLVVIRGGLVVMRGWFIGGKFVISGYWLRRGCGGRCIRLCRCRLEQLNDFSCGRSFLWVRVPTFANDFCEILNAN